eukprot:gene6913-18463_t
MRPTSADQNCAECRGGARQSVRDERREQMQSDKSREEKSRPGHCPGRGRRQRAIDGHKRDAMRPTCGALGIARGELRVAAPGMWPIRVSSCNTSGLLRWTGGLRGVRVGEAKNPGHNRSMSVTTSNVTALRAHVDLVARLAGDVKCLQETRLGKDAQRSMAKDLYQ